MTAFYHQEEWILQRTPFFACLALLLFLSPTLPLYHAHSPPRCGSLLVTKVATSALPLPPPCRALSTSMQSGQAEKVRRLTTSHRCWIGNCVRPVCPGGRPSRLRRSGKLVLTARQAGGSGISEGAADSQLISVACGGGVRKTGVAKLAARGMHYHFKCALPLQ